MNPYNLPYVTSFKLSSFVNEPLQSSLCDIIYGWTPTSLHTCCRHFWLFPFQLVERTRRCPTDRRTLPITDGRGELQLEVHLPLRVPGRRGEGCHLEEGVHVLLGRDDQQGSGETDFTGKLIWLLLLLFVNLLMSLNVWWWCCCCYFGC